MLDDIEVRETIITPEGEQISIVVENIEAYKALEDYFVIQEKQTLDKDGNPHLIVLMDSKDGQHSIIYYATYARDKNRLFCGGKLCEIGYIYDFDKDYETRFWEVDNYKPQKINGLILSKLRELVITEAND